jgi:hypothetical protein
MVRFLTSKILLFSLLLFSGLQASAQTEAEEEAVRKTFNNYKSAILNDQGAVAIKYVDRNTLRYYNDVLQLVKHADSAKVAALPIMDKMMVLLIRHRTPRGEILTFDGKSLFVYAVKSGMVGKQSVENSFVGQVLTEGDFAKGQYLMGTQKTALFLHFYKESGLWKIDLTSIFDVGSEAVQQLVTQSRQTENDFLFLIMEQLTGKEPDPQIWQPVE